MASGYNARGSSTEQEKSLTCAVCCEVFTSPRLLPCFHTFCLSCIEGLVRTHGVSFPCPACRKRTRVPEGGASAFQLNFYITEKELELARKPGPRMCPNHEDERLRFLCVKCDTVICRDCKLTKHDGHKCEDLSEAAASCMPLLTDAQKRIKESTKLVERKLEETQNDQEAAKEKRNAIEREINNRHAALVAAADKWRDRVKRELETKAEENDERLASITQNVQDVLDSLLDLQQRLDDAQKTGHHADVVDVEREMRVGSGSAEKLAAIEKSLPTTTSRLRLECDVDSLCDDDVRRYMGSVVTDTLEKKKRWKAFY